MEKCKFCNSANVAQENFSPPLLLSHFSASDQLPIEPSRTELDPCQDKSNGQLDGLTGEPSNEQVDEQTATLEVLSRVPVFVCLLASPSVQLIVCLFVCSFRLPRSCSFNLSNFSAPLEIWFQVEVVKVCLESENKLNFVYQSTFSEFEFDESGPLVLANDRARRPTAALRDPDRTSSVGALKSARDNCTSPIYNCTQPVQLVEFASCAHLHCIVLEDTLSVELKCGAALSLI